jgi:opine dehydrogenase
VTCVAVLGAGNGGFAAAVDLTLRGHDVRLWNRGAPAIEAVIARSAIGYRGVLGAGDAPIELATTDLGAAVRGADLVLVCLPAPAHEALAAALAPVLQPDQLIVLDPGGLLGSIAFSRTLRHNGYRDRLRIGETSTLTYIARKDGPDSVNITSVAVDLPFAALPAAANDEALADLGPVLPSLRPVANVIAAGIASINTVLHPPGVILGAAWIEHTGGDFAYYADTAVPSVARLMAAIDAERLAVAGAWDVTTTSFLEEFARIGSTSAAAAQARDHLQALRDSVPNRAIRAPSSLDSRYMHEDIPFGVVPLADLGRVAGIATPVLAAIITLASTVTGRDYGSEGRSLERVGLGGLPPAAVIDRVENGGLGPTPR